MAQTSYNWPAPLHRHARDQRLAALANDMKRFCAAVSGRAGGCCLILIVWRVAETNVPPSNLSEPNAEQYIYLTDTDTTQCRPLTKAVSTFMHCPGYNNRSRRAILQGQVRGESGGGKERGAEEIVVTYIRTTVTL